MQLVETSRSVQTFKMTYDKIFAKFHARIVEEYAAMRGGYMTDYQLNYDQNSSRRDDRLVEMNAAIEDQDAYTRDLQKNTDQQQSCLNTFFTQKSNLFRIKMVWKAWRFYFAVYKRKARLAAYMRNTLHRKKMDRLFQNWRGVTHLEFKVRMEHENAAFRQDIESKILVQWSTKVDALLLYVAELEERIRYEQDSREKLAVMYDQSLAVGYTRLTNETALLSQNPLVHEVVVDECVVPSVTATTSKVQAEMMARLRNLQASRRQSGASSQDGHPAQGQVLDRLTQHFKAQMTLKNVEEESMPLSPASLNFPPLQPLELGSNHEISGIQNWYDLGETDCALAFKNEYEVAADFSVTQSGILELY